MWSAHRTARFAQPLMSEYAKAAQVDITYGRILATNVNWKTVCHAVVKRKAVAKFVSMGISILNSLICVFKCVMNPVPFVSASQPIFRFALDASKDIPSARTTSASPIFPAMLIILVLR